MKAARPIYQEASPDEVTGAARDAPMDMGILIDTFGYLLRRAWRDSDRRFVYHFRTLDISAVQFSVMVLIDRNPGCTPGDLVVPMGITQNNMVGIIADLIKRGFVTKKTDANDRRARILTLTADGAKMLIAAHAVHEDYLAEYAERIGGGDMKELVRILRMFDRG
jgi:DNA-binding MarR family transcriptional regulator